MGDTAFEGDWANAFGLASRRNHPGTLVKTLTHLLSWYPRSQAITVFCYLLGQQPDVTAHSSEQRIHSCQAWMTPDAFQQANALGSFVYQPLSHRSLSTRKVHTALKEVLHWNTQLDMALFYEDFYPRNVLLVHPYIDRALQEFCLSLGPHHRTQFFAGFRISKVLLRLAYLGDLPRRSFLVMPVLLTLPLQNTIFVLTHEKSLSFSVSILNWHNWALLTHNVSRRS